jgi:ribosomal-protein-alanine N-acetyltransferase
LTPGRAAVAATAKVEAARPADLRSLVELDLICFGRRAWPEAAWVDAVTDPEWTTLVVRDGGTPIAASVLLLWPPGAHLASIGVHPDHRNRGLGTLLLRDAMARGRKCGARRLMLEVDLVNLAARRLYQREGFGLARRFREDGRWRVELQRRLRRSDGS